MFRFTTGFAKNFTELSHFFLDGYPDPQLSFFTKKRVNYFGSFLKLKFYLHYQTMYRLVLCRGRQGLQNWICSITPCSKLFGHGTNAWNIDFSGILWKHWLKCHSSKWLCWFHIVEKNDKSGVKKVAKYPSNPCDIWTHDMPEMKSAQLD